ncbi:hypothetical protein [Rhizobium leguminosarum]|uniref:hypothetical protein n=1 Tax=Rhizobium leguminosarum TaxID=384 RepID=UPI001C9183DF|nr:hypothetical protein [Rhizobium leguminosarum]MBY3044825.1 hypothetical protein [Rhizobium leguminosarum]
MKQKFQPAPHGSLIRLAEHKPSAIAAIAPESPRPPEMLTGVSFDGPALSVLDSVVHEILISHAYEVDREMKADRYAIDLAALTRFAGPNVRKDDILKSLEKLRLTRMSFGDSAYPARRYRGVQMVVAWEELQNSTAMIGYMFAPPIKDLMRTMPSYAYLELAALGDGNMSLKHSPALYKHLALQSTRKRWQPGENNEIYLRFSPQELAEVIRFPGHDDAEKLNVGKLVDFARKSVDDLASVRRFETSLDIVQEPGRGRRVNSICYTLRLRAPDFRHVRVGFDYSKKQEFRQGGADDPRFAVRSDLWQRATKTFKLTGCISSDLYKLWLVALQEALSGKGLTSGYEIRSYRGDALLAAVDTQGAAWAAWGFLEEECDDPDLVEHLADRSNAPLAIKTEAEAARRQRLGWKTSTLGKRATKFRKSAEPSRTDADELADYLAARELREQSEQIEAEMAEVWADIEEPVQQPKSVATVYRLDLSVSQEDFDIEVVSLFCEFSGPEQRLLRFEGSRFSATHKVSATAVQWARFERDIAAYLPEGIAA